MAGAFTGISTAISDLCFGLAFLSEAFFFNDSSWFPARGFRLLNFIRVTLWSRSSSLYSLHFSCPWVSATIRQHADRFHHFSFALHFQFPLLSRPTATTSFDLPFLFSCTPRLSRSPILSLPRLQLFFHRLSALDVRASCFLAGR